MSSSIGRIVKCSVFGESHGEVVGCVLNGLPAGEPIDMDEISLQMSRRAPGADKSSTPRRESDAPHILSGVLDGRTTGAPLAMIIKTGTPVRRITTKSRACPAPARRLHGLCAVQRV